MSNKDDERIGQVIDGRYEIIEKIAHGGMATVYRALDKRLDREVALKLMHPHLANGPEGVAFMSRFRREARAAARLHHQGIVTVFDQGLADNISYLTMEYVKGTNLRRRLKDVGTFSVGDALKNIEHILRALAAAHRAGLVHRDVKPENILINHRGQLQITDFGLARVATEMSTSTTGTVFGTVAYLAPEIIETGQSDARSDVYSIGVMLYELIAGQQPYKGTTPIQIAFEHVNEDIPVLSDIHPEIPRSVALLIEVLSARDKTKRPPDAAKALELLSKLAHSLSAADLVIKLSPPVNIESIDDQQVNLPQMPEELLAPENVASESDLSSSEIYRDIDASDSAIPFSTDYETPLNSEEIGVHDMDDNTAFMPPEFAQDSIETSFLGKSEIDTIKNSAHGLNSGLTDEIGLQNPVTANREKAETDQHHRKKVHRILAIVLVLLAVVLIGVSIWWYQALGPGSFATIPYGLNGTTAVEASAKVQAVGLKYEIVEENDDNVEAGKVLGTTPKAGDSISRYGDGVKILVSKGVLKLAIPQGIVGADVDSAQKALKDVGFSDIKVVRTYNNIKKDQVMSIDPDEGAADIPHNASITLAVSDGPKPVSISNLQGMAIDQAIALIEENGLNYSRTDTYSDSVASGVVISQNPISSAAHTFYEGDTIALTVSKGPETTDVPDVKGKTVADAKAALEALGLIVSIRGEAELGLVQKQDIAPGTKVKRGSTVTITVV